MPAPPSLAAFRAKSRAAQREALDEALEGLRQRLPDLVMGDEASLASAVEATLALAEAHDAEEGQRLRARWDALRGALAFAHPPIDRRAS